MIVLYSNDATLLDYWSHAMSSHAEISFAYTQEELTAFKDEIIILDYDSCKPDCQKLIRKIAGAGNKLLVLDRVPDLLKAKKILHWGAKGYGNVLMHAHFLESAINTLNEDMIWLHPDVTSQLILQIPESSKEHENLLKNLTQREKEVALLLKDGLTYTMIAQQLKITPRTVKAHAHSIYKKLGVDDRVGLALLLR